MEFKFDAEQRLELVKHIVEKFVDIGIGEKSEDVRRGLAEIERFVMTELLEGGLEVINGKYALPVSDNKQDRWMLDINQQDFMVSVGYFKRDPLDGSYIIDTNEGNAVMVHSKEAFMLMDMYSRLVWKK